MVLAVAQCAQVGHVQLASACQVWTFLGARPTEGRQQIQLRAEGEREVLLAEREPETCFSRGFEELRRTGERNKVRT